MLCVGTDLCRFGSELHHWLPPSLCSSTRLRTDSSISSSTTARVLISVNGGAVAGSFASCFSVGSGATCGAVSAVIVTTVDLMYEVGFFSCILANFQTLIRFTLTSSLLRRLQTLSTLLAHPLEPATCA
jgi:hypothetical protein